MFELAEESGPFVVIRASGKLDAQDYQVLVPELERIIESEGKLRLLLLLEDFHGWDAGALLEDLRFDIAHRTDFERTAVVGDRTWLKWATRLTAPFFSGQFRYFEPSDVDAARTWVLEGAEEPRPQPPGAQPPG